LHAWTYRTFKQQNGILHAWTYRIFKQQQNGIVLWNTGTSKQTIPDDRRMQKGESDIFCMLGRIVLSNNKNGIVQNVCLNKDGN
jgi:hypothetical protein